MSRFDRQATQSFFDGRADHYYDRNYVAPRNRHEHNLALRRELCLELLADVRGRILDLGCGPGAMTVPLGQRGHEVVAFDLSPAMVSEARRLGRELGAPARFCVGDATALPFGSAAFDAVVTTGVLEYVPDVARALAEIARVLRPGGVLVGTASLPRRLERWAMQTMARVRAARAGVAAPAPYQRGFSRREFDALVSAGGFAIDARRHCYFAPFPFDAVAPASVPALDHRLGALLERLPYACDHAKTYVVRAHRS